MHYIRTFLYLPFKISVTFDIILESYIICVFQMKKSTEGDEDEGEIGKMSR